MDDGMIECIHEDQVFIISGSEAVATFTRLTTNIQCQPEWEGKFSEKYISTKLRKILAALSSQTPESLIPQLENFVEHLQSFQKVQECVMPIQGLKLEVEELHLGSITFRPADQQQLDHLRERAEKTILTMKLSDDEKQHWLLHYRKVIEERLGAFDTLAFSKSIAEVDQARVNALDAIDMVLNVLRFFAPYTQDFPEYVGLGLPGNFSKAAYSSFVFSEDGSFNTDFPSSGRHLPFKVDKEFLELHGNSLKSFSEIIANPTRTELENRILVAIQWAGKAQSDSQPQQQLLSLITALECLLNPTDGRPFRIGLSESAALLIGKEDLGQRVRLFDFLASMYDKRSKVSHGGSIDIANSEIRSLQGITGAVIMKIVGVRANFMTRKELESCLGRARLGATLDL